MFPWPKEKTGTGPPPPFKYKFNWKSCPKSNLYLSGFLSTFVTFPLTQWIPRRDNHPTKPTNQPTSQPTQEWCHEGRWWLWQSRVITLIRQSNKSPKFKWIRRLRSNSSTHQGTILFQSSCMASTQATVFISPWMAMARNFYLLLTLAFALNYLLNVIYLGVLHDSCSTLFETARNSSPWSQFHIHRSWKWNEWMNLSDLM